LNSLNFISIKKGSKSYSLRSASGQWKFTRLWFLPSSIICRK